MFEKRGLSFAIDEFHKSHTSEQDFIKDICDGSEMKKLEEKFNGHYDVRLLWNTDGISLGEKSVYHMWPILYTFCEIPPRLRPYFICVSSVWYEKRDPLMHMFTQPFVDSLVKIHEEGGVCWTHPVTKEKITSQVSAPAAVADAPCRADLQNVKRFNGINGCNTCEITCPEVVVDGKTRHFYVFQENSSNLRSGRKMRRQAELAKTKQGFSVKGVKGVSPLDRIPHLDVGKFVFPEYMHSLLLGVVYSFTLLMINFDDNWRLKKRMKDIDNIILSLKVPDFMKMPQILRLLKYFKAHELRAWLLFLSLPILEGFLPEKNFQHWMLLVAASYLLLQEKISDSDLEVADLMLKIFVRDVEKLYSITAYKYNTHQLLHLTLTVRRWGPLWANSSFMFEDYNGTITRMIHGTKHKGKEFVKNLKIASGLLSLKRSIVNNNDGVFSKKDVMGFEVKDFAFSDSEMFYINNVRDESFQVFLRIKVDKTVYASKVYDENVKRCNSYATVIVNGEQQVAEIVCYVKFSVNQDIWCFVDIYHVDHTRLFVHKATRYQLSHILPIKKTPTERVFVSIDNLGDKLIKVRDYVCMRPNTIEVNL